MALNVLGISASPRPLGNTDLLLREALAGAGSAGAATERLALSDYSIAPCVECHSCERTGMCRVRDDYQVVLDKLLAADRLIFATPVFFMSVTAQAKVLIDRCQCLWAAKYRLKKPLFEGGGRDRRAMVISVGGSRSVQMFDSIRLTMKYFWDALEVAYVSNLFINQVDERGGIQKHPRALAEAFRLGRELAADAGPPPQRPVDVLIVDAMVSAVRGGESHGE